MPLSILGPMVVGGIAFIAVLLHLMGLSRRAQFGDTDDVRAAWLAEFPEDRAIAVTLSHDHHAALVETASKRHGIVFPMGADSTARYLNGANARVIKGGLRVDLSDFTAPRIRLKLDPDEAARWPQMMKDMP